MDSQNTREDTMLFKEYALKNGDAIATALGSSLEKGLSAESVQAKLKEFGKNQQSERVVSWWQIFLRHITSIFIILFFVIDVFFLLLGEWSNALIVLMLMVINVCVGVYQEYKASKTIKLLRKYIETSSLVLRNGKQEEIPTTDLVPGDIVFLKVGDIVPADMRIITEKGLMVDEAIITGESASIKKTDKVIEAETDLFKAFNILFTGTVVVEGEATGIVFATAHATVFGSLVQNSYRSWQESTLEKGVIQLSKFIILLSVVSLICIFIGNVIVKGFDNIDFIQLLFFATALMVSIVPEALPIVVTFNLSLGVRRLIKLNVVVKRLSALEDLGAVEILCVDKTGTLTEHRMDLVDTYGADLEKILLYNALSLLSRGNNKNNFESAVEKFLVVHNPTILTQAAKDYEFVSASPFDPERRRSGVLVRRKNSSEYIYVLRGAYEIMAKNCFMGNQESQDWIVKEGLKGNRTLAVAIKNLTHAPDNLIAEEHDCTLVGILAFSDPIKKTAAVAIDRARDLGITIKVISGDSPEVCGTVAFALKLIDDPKKVVTSKMLEAASLEEKEQLIQEGMVFSRMLPDQKAEIVQILRRNKRVGFMGDGLNDLPALMCADAALVVQGCPDVVREAGDIILLNRSLLSIIEAITEGRTVLANTMKYIKTTFAASFGNFYALALASLFINYIPMLPLQILLLNFLSDFPLIALATDTVEQEELSKPQQYNIRSILLIAIILGIVSMIFDFICFSYFMKKSEKIMQSGWFIESVLTEIVFIFSIRSHQLFFKAKRPSMGLTLCSLIIVFLTFIIPHSALGQRLFGFVSLDHESLFFVCGLAGVYFICTEIIKHIYYKLTYIKNSNGVRRA